MKISMRHPGVKRSPDASFIEIDEKSAALRDAWLLACEVYRLAFLEACRHDPELDRLSDLLQELEADPDVMWHAALAGSLGEDHAKRVAQARDTLIKLQARIARNRDLHLLQIAAHDAHAAHDVNWEMRFETVSESPDGNEQ